MFFICTIIYHLAQNEEIEPTLLDTYIFASGQILIFYTLITYFLDKDYRREFLLHNKVTKLLSEQRVIFNKMPDGLIIHQQVPTLKKHPSDADRDDQTLLKYFNMTFKSMFMI